MAEKTLHSLKVNATRLGQRLGENLAGESPCPHSEGGRCVLSGQECTAGGTAQEAISRRAQR
jgi:hypothetical protein